MPPKKKGTKDRFANMTEEEKAAYLEQQRLAEEESKAKKATMLSKYLQDKLEKEERMSKLNNFKLLHHWRIIMRDAKSKELRNDIQILSQTFERIIDRKDNIIRTLIKDLNEAEEQHMLSLRSHLENIDNMTDLQNERLRKLKTDYESEMQRLVKEFGEEEQYLIAKHTKQLDDLKDIFVALDSAYAHKANDAKAEQHSLKDELRNRVRILLNKAERIIKLAEHCRKYETEAEKVVPFYVSSLTEDEEAQVQKAFQVDGDDELAQILRQCVPLEMFWRRFNKVQLDRLAILKEHSVLEQENRQLKSLLKQYLDGISVNANVLEANNTLIVVNGRSNVNRRELTEDPRIRMLTCPTKSEFTADAPMQIPQQDTNTPFA
ncbi:unnamed protein product [Dicrocoelium dendriticum]|nr:unnamed protein product [Dicrocoelium dendriticum]